MNRYAPGEKVTGTVRQGSPESFGWLRRPELDHGGAIAYERPDGRLVAFDPRQPNTSRTVSHFIVSPPKLSPPKAEP